MGQYYQPTNIDKKESLYSHDYNNGLKLMEHSYIGNRFVAAAMLLLEDHDGAHTEHPTKDGSWSGDHFVWAGDYSEFAGSDDTRGIYEEADNNRIQFGFSDLWPNEVGRYIVNLDKKEYVNLSKYIGQSEPDEWGFVIHPLPLLTCEGNGNGGGDFFGTDAGGVIGTWARDRITVVKKDKLPEGFTDITKKCNFKEK